MSSQSVDIRKFTSTPKPISGEPMIINGYESCLKACGLDPVLFVKDDDYQGCWAALLPDQTVIRGDFGSCSVCDEIDSLLDYRRNSLTLDEARSIIDCATIVPLAEFVIPQQFDYISAETRGAIAQKALELGWLNAPQNP